MTAYLDLPVGLKAKLWSHLLQNELEQVAFVFAAVETNADATVFTAKDHYLATPDDFEIHSEFHVELTDEARRESSSGPGTPAPRRSSFTRTPATIGERCSRQATCTASASSCRIVAGDSAAGRTWPSLSRREPRRARYGLALPASPQG